jgi:hypothetical protein
MAEPEMPEVRAEQQRQDRPDAPARYDRVGRGLGARPWVWAAFALAVAAVIAIAYTVA